MRIDSYEFGRIVIDGRTYASDVIVFPDRVKSNWWRREGHKLHVDDLKEIFAARPEVLVVGKGYSGMMEVPRETAEYVKARGIELVTEDTHKAVEVYNRLSRSKKVVAALHLTC